MARLHQELMNDVLARIVAGEYSSRLPREQDLVELWGVSRGVVRETLRALEERGVIAVKHGRGQTVQPYEHWDVLDPDVLPALTKGNAARRVLPELTEARGILEVGAAGLAATRATAEQVAAIENALAGIAEHSPRRPGARGRAEVELHRTVVAAANNTFISRVLGPALEATEAFASHLGRRSESQEEHRELVAALSRRDATAAEAAMRAHFAALMASLSTWDRAKR